VRLSHPDGRQIDSDAPDAAAAIAAAFGADVASHAAPPPGLKLAFAPGTLGGLHAQTTEFPVSSASPENTFFDLAPLLIVAGATLRALSGSEGTDACIKRLRPNLVLEDPVASAFVENSWVGRRLAIGPEVVIKVMIACPRCVMPNLSRADLPADPGFLRRVAQANTYDLGDFGHSPARVPMRRWRRGAWSARAIACGCWRTAEGLTAKRQPMSRRQCDFGNLCGRLSSSMTSLTASWLTRD
jgi:hypothetical protein